MKAFYQITSSETGTIVLKRRKIAKALRWWLRENGYPYKYTFFVSQDRFANLTDQEKSFRGNNFCLN
jgi:hypothetical protein